MKNCVKGCGTVTNQKHCDAKGCLWYGCPKCEIAFDPQHIERQIPWAGPVK